VVAFLVVGVNAVWRAEFPRRRLVERVRYTSPMIVGTQEDHQAKYRSSEFRGFRRFAWGAVLEGLDPYADLGHVRAYPPFFGIAFLPFAVLWRVPGLGSGLFYVIGFGFALLSAYLCARWTEERPRFGVFALLFILLAPLAMNVLVRCETDMLVLLPVAAAFSWFVRGRRGFACGLLLGFAASFKVLPGLFGVYLLLRRRWWASLGMAAAGLACTVMLPALVWGPRRAWALHVSWYRHVVAPYATADLLDSVGPPARASNQSLTAALFRYLRPIRVRTQGYSGRVNLLRLEPGTVLLAARLMHACVAVGLLGLWALTPVREPAALRRGALYASVCAGILLLSSVSLTTHHVLLLVPLSVVLVSMLAMGDERACRWGWVVAVYAAAMVGIAVPFIKVLTPLLPATACLLAACVALALRRETG